jgi:hypothetical protein
VTVGCGPATYAHSSRQILVSQPAAAAMCRGLWSCPSCLTGRLVCLAPRISWVLSMSRRWCTSHVSSTARGRG